MVKRRKIDSQRERRILIALITNTPFLTQAVRMLDLDLITTPHFRQVAEWCVTHAKKYGKAPGEHIETLYHTWSEDNENTTLVESVHDFLDTLSKEYEKEHTTSDTKFLLQDLATFLNRRRIEKIQESVGYALTHGDVAEAEKALLLYRPAEIEKDTSILPLTKKVWIEPFSEPLKPLISFSGDAGRFFNRALVRNGLVAIQAPEKTGKTWWLIEFMIRALRQRHKVAMFQVGDLSQKQFLLRLAMRWAGRPLWPDMCGRIKIPKRVVIDDGEDIGYLLKHVTRRVTHPVDRKSAVVGYRRFKRSCGVSTKNLRVSVHAMNSINVEGINTILDQWKRVEGFEPDVVLIDYADILAPEPSGRRHEHDRNVINDTWKALRRLSQERENLVITATQANAQSYTQEPRLQTMRNFSEDKRKLAHVTGMFALNQTPDEKDIQGMRLNWIVLREAPFNTNRPLFVGQCLPLGRAMTCAAMGKFLTKKEESD